MSDTSAIDSASRAEHIRKLFNHITELHEGIIETEQLNRLRELCPSPTSWRLLISAIPLDNLSFDLEVGIQCADAIRILSRWCRSFTDRMPENYDEGAAEIHGFLSVLLITLITMEEGALSFNESSINELNGEFREGLEKHQISRHNCEETCGALTMIPSVRSTLLALYAPYDLLPIRDSGQNQTFTEWERIKPESLEFHRHGSTSFILRGLHEMSAGRQVEFALKCVLLPYSKVPVIANKTASYATDHNSLDTNGRSVQHMVRVWASTTRWILMDFIEGVTLSEEIESLRRNPPVSGPRRRIKRNVPLEGNVRLDFIRILGLPLLESLSELHRGGKRHEDLSPTNIIVRRRSNSGDGNEYDVTFIDFGRNYLYTQMVGGGKGPESAFIAPEVRGNENDVASADVYSMGRIIIALGDVGENRDGTVPDRFYGQAPLVARVIEDLVDEKPERRLLIFGSASDGKENYGALKTVLEQEIDVTQAELESDSGLRKYVVPYEKEPLRSSLGSFFQLSRESKKKWRIYQVRKLQGVLSEPRQSMYARWLLTFSVLAAFSYFIAAFVCISWFFRDIGFDILSPPIQGAMLLMGMDANGVPIVDDLRQPDYELGQVVDNLPARIIGLSFALASARYYQNILSGLTTRVARPSELSGATSRFVTEVAMRTMAIWPLLLILAANLVQVRWWTLASAIGYTSVLLSNFLSARFAKKQLTMARDRGLSTVPPSHQKVSGLDSYQQWSSSMLIYASMVWIFAFLIDYGVLKDVLMYSILVAVVNVGLFYFIKTGGANALNIRTGLNRCFLAAERLRYEKE